MLASETKTLLVEDHALVAEMLGSLLRDEVHAKLIGSARSLAEARVLLNHEAPDLVVVDWTLPDGRGLDLVREFRAATPKTRWVCVSATEQPHLVREAADLGVEGFVLKRSPASVFRQVVCEVMAGRASYCPESAKLLVHSVVTDRQRIALTPRERELVRRTARGEHPKKIADALGMQPKTVNNLLSGLKDKLGLSTSAEFVHYAIRNGLIEAP